MPTTKTTRTARAEADRTIELRTEAFVNNAEALEREIVDRINLLPDAVVAAAVQSKIDLRAILSRALANRGLNDQGKWIGFPTASAQHEERMQPRDGMKLAEVETELAAIAHRELGFTTLKTRNSDALDFREVSAAAVNVALMQAALLGAKAVR